MPAKERDPEFGPWLSQASILIVDDEPGMRNFLVRTLGPRCRHIEEATDTDEASRKLDAHHFDVVILDNVMPGKNGVDWLAEQRAIGFFAEAILITAFADLETAIQALRAGAVDFVLKPFRSNQILNSVARCLDRMRLQRENFVLRHELKATSDHILLRDKLIGTSSVIGEVRDTIARVAPLPTSVLISGESGTGKELVARAIHDMGARAAAPFIAINMAAIPRELIEAELFGHERGAFTGAQARTAGRFEQAAGGTLFLDEIGDMPMEAQTRLLRVLQSGEFTTVGGARTIRADVRIVAATNRDLAAQVAGGAFREDLFYRLNVVPVMLPSLRERRQDIALLAHHFLDQAARDGLPRRQLAGGAVELLERHDWPGNVRELENLMRRLAALSRDEVIDAATVREMIGTATSPIGEPSAGIAGAVKMLVDRIAREQPSAMDDGTLYDRVIAEVERPLIEAMLARHGQNQLRAAKALGINRNTLRKRLDTLGIEPGVSRSHGIDPR